MSVLEEFERVVGEEVRVAAQVLANSAEGRRHGQYLRIELKHRGLSVDPPLSDLFALHVAHGVLFKRDGLDLTQWSIRSAEEFSAVVADQVRDPDEFFAWIDQIGGALLAREHGESDPK